MNLFLKTHNYDAFHKFCATVKTDDGKRRLLEPREPGRGGAMVLVPKEINATDTDFPSALAEHAKIPGVDICLVWLPRLDVQVASIYVHRSTPGRRGGDMLKARRKEIISNTIHALERLTLDTIVGGDFNIEMRSNNSKAGTSHALAESNRLSIPANGPTTYSNLGMSSNNSGPGARSQRSLDAFSVGHIKRRLPLTDTAFVLELKRNPATNRPYSQHLPIAIVTRNVNKSEVVKMPAKIMWNKITQRHRDRFSAEVVRRVQAGAEPGQAVASSQWLLPRSKAGERRVQRTATLKSNMERWFARDHDDMDSAATWDAIAAFYGRGANAAATRPMKCDDGSLAFTAKAKADELARAFVTQYTNNTPIQPLPEGALPDAAALRAALDPATGPLRLRREEIRAAIAEGESKAKDEMGLTPQHLKLLTPDAALITFGPTFSAALAGEPPAALRRSVTVGLQKPKTTPTMKTLERFRAVSILPQPTVVIDRVYSRRLTAAALANPSNPIHPAQVAGRRGLRTETQVMALVQEALNAAADTRLYSEHRRAWFDREMHDKNNYLPWLCLVTPRRDDPRAPEMQTHDPNRWTHHMFAAQYLKTRTAPRPANFDSCCTPPAQPLQPDRRELDIDRSQQTRAGVLMLCRDMKTAFPMAPPVAIARELIDCGMGEFAPYVIGMNKEREFRARMLGGAATLSDPHTDRKSVV